MAEKKAVERHPVPLLEVVYLPGRITVKDEENEWTFVTLLIVCA